MFNYCPRSFLVDFQFISGLSYGRCGSFLIIAAKTVKRPSFCVFLQNSSPPFDLKSYFSIKFVSEYGVQRNFCLVSVLSK